MGGEDGDLEIPSTLATCRECSHETASFGRSINSVKRCLTLMHEECPLRRNNYYIEGSARRSVEAEWDDAEDDRNQALFAEITLPVVYCRVEPRTR